MYENFMAFRLFRQFFTRFVHSYINCLISVFSVYIVHEFFWTVLMYMYFRTWFKIRGYGRICLAYGPETHHSLSLFSRTFPSYRLVKTEHENVWVPSPQILQKVKSPRIYFIIFTFFSSPASPGPKKIMSRLFCAISVPSWLAMADSGRRWPTSP